ncbi:MAG: arylesterase [Bdellovibrio sp.]|nr:MAG: arylesterase [Bdellovibrio sp.]
MAGLILLISVSFFFYKYSRQSAQPPQPTQPAQPTPIKTLVVLGDSLTEGYGVPRDKAFPALLEKMINDKSPAPKWKVVNAGISGSTSASGPQRMAWQLKGHPDLIILALGGNDGLRGFKVSETRKNLAETIRLARDQKVPVILAGMRMPPNYGMEYTKDFREIFPELAKDFGIPLIPFLLDKVAGIRELNQNDGIHPTEKGHELIAETVYKSIEKYLRPYSQ